MSECFKIFSPLFDESEVKGVLSEPVGRGKVRYTRRIISPLVRCYHPIVWYEYVGRKNAWPVGLSP